MRTILHLICLLVFLVSACKENVEVRINSLVGSWKAENKEDYEDWWRVDNNRLEGESYTKNDGSKKILETLSIRISDEEIVYVARVFEQNEGQIVSFILNSKNKEFLSFENEAHDFPKKIQYQPISHDELFVKVVGDSGKGFSYTMTRQGEE